MMRTARWSAVVGVCLLGSACAGTGVDYATNGMTPEERAKAYASVDVPAACYKPQFDTISASDRRTIIKGQTPLEREVCQERNKADQFSGR